MTRVPSKKWTTRADLAERVEFVRAFLDERPEVGLSISAMAEIAMISKFHFVRLFAETYGQSPVRYRTERRFEKAKRLVESGKNLTEACFLVGYSSPTTFITNYHKRFDHSSY